MSTQLGSTSILDNHKLQDCDMSEGDDQDDTCSSYKPSPEMTKGCNSDSQTYCDSPLCGELPTPPPLLSLPPLYPYSPLSTRTWWWWPSPTALISLKDNTTVPKELPSPVNTLVNSVQGLGEEGGEGESPKVESNQPEKREELGEGGPPDPGPLGGTSGPSELPDPGCLPAPNKTAVRRNLINKTSWVYCIKPWTTWMTNQLSLSLNSLVSTRQESNSLSFKERAAIWTPISSSFRWRAAICPSNWLSHSFTPLISTHCMWCLWRTSLHNW